MYLPLAASCAHRASSFMEAEALYEQALGLLEGPDDRRIWCRLGLTDLLRLTGKTEEAAARFKAILDEARVVSDDRARIHALLGLGTVSWCMHQVDDAVRWAEEARALAAEVSEPYLEARSHEDLARAFLLKREVPFAEAEAKKAFTLFEAAGDTQRALRMEQLLDALLVDDGCYAEAGEHFRARRADAERLGDQRQLAWLAMGEARTALERGWYAEALRGYDAVAAGAEERGDHRIAAHALLGAAHALLSRMEFEEVDERLTRAWRAIGAAGRDPILLAAYQCRKAWRAFLEGSEDGDRQAVKLAGLAAVCDDPLVRSFALATRGVVMLVRGGRDDARALLSQAMEEAGRARNRFCGHLYATFRAACDVHEAGESLPLESDDDAARKWLEAALEFGLRNESREVLFRALAGLVALGVRQEEELAAAGRSLAAAAGISLAKLLRRRDLELVVRGGSRLAVVAGAGESAALGCGSGAEVAGTRGEPQVEREKRGEEREQTGQAVHGEPPLVLC
jgi:tetratricopeptide (TPR) repeat protein